MFLVIKLHVVHRIEPPSDCTFDQFPYSPIFLNKLLLYHINFH